MSLDGCKSDSVFCKIDSEPYFIKIIYNKLTKNKNYLPNKNILNDLYTNLSKNIDNTGEIDNIFRDIELCYTKPNGVEQLKYIFVGECDKDIKTELRKIEESKKLDTVNVELLVKYFNFKNKQDFINELGDLAEFTKIQFVYFIINAHENHNLLYKAISNYMNSEQDILMMNRYIYMVIIIILISIK